MPFAVELLLDPDAEERIRHLWDQLAEAGANSAMRDGGHPPHVTLGIYRRIVDPTGLESALALVAAQYAPRDTLHFGFVGLFPGEEGVVFAGLAATPDLLALQRSVLAACAPFVESPQEYYGPGRWVPHVTLAIRVPVRKRGDVLAVALKSVGLAAPAAGRALALEQIPQGERLLHWPLVGSSETR